MRGKVVCSKSGRDKGYFMVIVKCEEGVAFVCDGKERPLERPKKKNLKHLQLTNKVLCSESLNTNKSLRKALAVYKSTVMFKEEP